MNSRGVAALAVLLLTIGALAGCTAPAPKPEPVALKESPAQGGLIATRDLANVTSQEREQGQNQSEFSKSLDEKFHTHNYWGESLEKLLMDADVASSSLLPTPSNNHFRFDWSFGGAVDFALPEGSIVPPETVRLEVAVTWTKSPTITGLRLGYHDALGQGDYLDAMPDGGATNVIETNLTRNDIPHTTVSKWGFSLFPDSRAFLGAFNGTVHVAIKAFRNDTLLVAPPHPDLWGSETHKVLLENTTHMAGTSAGFTFNIDGNDWVWLQLPNASIIPPHTGLITVTLLWANKVATPDPFTTHPVLRWWPANYRDQAPEASVQSEPGKAVYTIPVDPRMVDSPYAEQSNWGFMLRLNSDAPTEQAIGFGSVGGFDGDVAVAITADRETTPM